MRKHNSRYMNFHRQILIPQHFISQAGLGGLVSLFTVITLVSGVAPKRYIERHTVKTRDVVTMNLKVSEFVQILGLAIAGGCGLFLLGNYGVEGDFSSVFLENLFNSVMILGGASLFITAVWKSLVIRTEVRSGEKRSDKLRTGPRSEAMILLCESQSDEPRKRNIRSA